MRILIPLFIATVLYTSCNKSRTYNLVSSADFATNTSKLCLYIDGNFADSLTYAANEPDCSSDVHSLKLKSGKHLVEARKADGTLVCSGTLESKESTFGSSSLSLNSNGGGTGGGFGVRLSGSCMSIRVTK